MEQGTWEDGELNGIGKRIHKDGRILEGEFIGGNIYNGKGVSVQGSGVVEVGEWEEGLLRGSISSADGASTVHGVFRNGMVISGTGRLLHRNGITIDEGKWEDGVFHGTRTSDEGCVSRGEFRDLGGGGTRMYTGTGRLQNTNGDIEEGEWQFGCLVGKRTSVDGRVVEGEFLEGRVYNCTGSVKHTSDGRVETGCWVNGLLEGQGEIIYKDGSMLQGVFHHGRLQSGSGVHRLPGGIVLQGSWEEGGLCGPGRSILADKKVLEGNFRHGLLHGEGVVVDADGNRLEGEFRQGKIFNGSGFLRHRDGNIEEGHWVDGLLDGPGMRFRKKDGCIQEGNFMQGKLHGQGVLL